MFRKLASVLIVSIGTALTAPSQAAVLFSDNFDADNAASVLNFNSLINWTVSDGTIDYIRQGGYGISCFGGSGGCLDMDGSTSNAGRITSKSTFAISPGVTYRLEGQISGNQRGGSSDARTIGIVDADTLADLLTVTLSGIVSSTPFDLAWMEFSLDTARTVRIFVEGSGGDNLGVILDNVVFRNDEVNGAPEPGTLALLGLGLAGLAATRRRMR